ncbi:MAG: TIGR00730 family Rossman fold protein [Acidobacteria bacterium]|nr:TIGR00730 family Rossman fold protein [Acidobacteriota bacterium]
MSPLDPQRPAVVPAEEPVDHTDRPAPEALPNPAGKAGKELGGPGSTPTAAAVPPSNADRVLLAGPNPRFTEALLVLRSVRDFIRGFRVLHFVGPCVVIFGSARFGEAHPYYAIGREMGRRVSLLGFTVLTGGGPGLMEAANRGARDVGGRSIGCNIELPMEQVPNAYLDRWISCHYFFVRKVLLFKYSYAFIALPGGLGTLDELCEALTLIQTGKIREYPVVLIGAAYWQPFLALLREMSEEGAISSDDLNLLKITDDLDDAIAHIEQHAVAAFGLRRRPLERPRWWLGEFGIARAARGK